MIKDAEIQNPEYHPGYLSQFFRDLGGTGIEAGHLMAEKKINAGLTG